MDNQEVNRVEIPLATVRAVRFAVTRDSDVVTLEFTDTEEKIDIPINGDYAEEFPLDALLSIINEDEWINLQLVAYR
jgi:hypothetical protein